jgi:hypothetical protein
MRRDIIARLMPSRKLVDGNEITIVNQNCVKVTKKKRDSMQKWVVKKK